MDRGGGGGGMYKYMYSSHYAHCCTDVDKMFCMYQYMILEKCILFTETKIVSSNSAYFFGLDIEINLSLLIFRGFIAFDDKEQFFLYCILDQT